MNIKAYANYLSEWLEQQRKHFYHADGYLLGISGGIDSAVALHLAARTKAPVHALMLPAAVNDPQDIQDSESILKSAGISGCIVSIAPIYDTFWQQIRPVLNPNPERVNVLHGNLMARLRMVCLYTAAQSHNAIVIGTDNAAETYMGYCTKYGDGAADVLPLAHLRKEQIYELGQLFHLPERILKKPPGAGLWAGQTDEEEMGVRYTEIDAFLRGETVSPDAREKIRFWHERSQHKRRLPPTPLTPNELE